MLHQQGSPFNKADNKEKQDHSWICRICLVLRSVSRAIDSKFASRILHHICSGRNHMHDTIMPDDVFLVDKSAII
jgi:hypothetical protein